MSVLGMFDKLSGIIYEPIKLITDWTREPLKGREHRRSIEVQEHTIKAESEARMNEASHIANIEDRQKKVDAELEIKKNTEVQRILAEIEEIKKDKDFERMKAVSEAIMQYQQHLTKLNVSAINAIGHMQLELREKAQNLVYDKTIKYKQLQDSAYSQAYEEMQRIEKDFSDNEVAKNILYKSVDTRLANIVITAQNFLIELNNDIAVLNKSINFLTERGQSFIEDHLGQFHVVANGSLLSEQNTLMIQNREKVITDVPIDTVTKNID
ncbi:hypothetical protein [Nitrosomonas sp. Nm58]|uniref:hypothetical protein n=1 Tax=Nitrosomonas sp. Nm58 TaxID=200126 RepID=UPI000899232D|nr:hypothetical protein [Nitrosomonas sp. Nm58]SDZ02371.1 hypothetical protein SAMN05421754_10444 [Nitrosomonas sp. Nm58]